MSKKIYFISGLGADEQIFSRLHLQHAESVYLQWILPQKNESIAAYAARMFQQIEEKNPVLVGVSFGGIIGIEIAKQFPIKKLILISTAKTRQELPWWMKTAGKFRLLSLIKPKPHPILYPIEDFFLGVHVADEKKW